MDSWYLVCASPSTVFIPILLKLYRRLDHALKMCIWFGYNPQINFDTFLQFKLKSFFGNLH